MLCASNLDPRMLQHFLSITQKRPFFVYVIIGKLIQIDSGPFGVVCGVNRFHHIFCRKGISLSTPQGTGWVRVPGALKYVSCGVYGCWGVNSANHIWFRHGVTSQNCAARKWVKISGALAQLEVYSVNFIYICDFIYMCDLRGSFALTLFSLGQNFDNCY